MARVTLGVQCSGVTFGVQCCLTLVPVQVICRKGAAVGRKQRVLLRDFHLAGGSLALGKLILLETNAGKHAGNVWWKHRLRQEALVSSARTALCRWAHLGAFEGDLS